MALADPGDVDENFGTLGHTTVDLAGNDVFTGIELQAGKILLAGDTAGASSVSRFLGS